MASIAIIGAARNRDKFGNKAVRAYVQRGWKVFAVNPNCADVEGLKCYGSVRDLPETPGFASLYVPPEIGVRLLKGIAEKGTKVIYVNPGADSPELIAEAKRLGLQPIMACSIRAIGANPDEI